LLADADRYFRDARPDALVLIDYPGFHWWLARCARRRGIPVIYFVPPQLWAWAGWRVRKMRRRIDHVLCNLPFEEAWYRDRGVSAHYVGHPYFDELAQQGLDRKFVKDQRARPGTVVGLLPGSRNQEVDRNLDLLVDAAQYIHAARPDVRFLVASFNAVQQRMVSERLRSCPLPLEVCVGHTPQIIQLSHSCIAVSGSVGLELLYHGKPSVVVYRVRRAVQFLSRVFMTVPYISLVNLLADKELFPEFLTYRNEAAAVGGHIVDWLGDAAKYQQVCAELTALRQRVATPGACERAAAFVLAVMNRAESLAA
jgi:lipid-A-disaccharide synthase